MESKGDEVDEPDGTAARALVARDYALFVVHAAADGEFVHGYLLPALNLPLDRVLLVDKLRPGLPIVSEIERGVSRSRFTVAVLSAAYLADRWAVFGARLASYASVEDAHVIPLRLTDEALPLDLEFRVALDFTDRTRWASQATRLRALLHTTAPVAEQIPCPYPGMRPFTANEASRFFGRDKELGDLVGRLDHGEREIYVIGPSGSGKSSLVQAGLLHVLDAGSSRLRRSFCVRAMRPGARPTERLARALEGDLAAVPSAIDVLVGRHPPAARVLVFVDQFEELFTLADAAERQAFLAALRRLRAEPRCHLLFTLRADFFGALMDSELWPDLAGRISRLEVAPLRGPALAEAITAPARRVDVHLEARLCDRIVADAAAEPGALSHVQETLRLLWEQRRLRLLGLAEYEALGDGESGLHIALARHADATMRALTATQQTIARRVLLRLVSFGEGRADTRRQQQLQALRSVADDEAEFARVLQRLVDDRLVTVDGAEGTDDALVDLSHEALITSWPMLREWVARRQTDEQHRRRFDTKVSEWIERGRGLVSLLDPVELAEAEYWMPSDAARELGYGAELRALVSASRREIERVERQRRRRAFRSIAVLAAFSVVASILGLVAWTQRQEERRLVAIIYMEQGHSLLRDGHPMKALPYLVAAKSQGGEIPLLRELFARASRNMPLVTFAGHKLSVVEASFSGDGTRVVTASWDRTARVWDAVTGKPVTPPLEHQGQVHAVAFSPDGARVITVSLDKTARIWNARTGTPMTPPLQHQSAISSAMFSADGTRVVTASQDRTARVWDASTGDPVTPPLEHQSLVTAAAFSADGTRVVTASWDKTARVWDAVTGKSVIRLEHQGPVTAASFSPDGTRVVTASWDKTARIWDAVTGQPVAPPLEHHDTVTAVSFSPDGTHVVTASWDKTARVWDAVTGQPVTPPLQHQGLVTAASFSLDGARVVTASEDKTAQIWDAVTGDLAAEPLEHQGAVMAAVFSPDGTRVITASSDRTARIWDASPATTRPRSLDHVDVGAMMFHLDDVLEERIPDDPVDTGSLEDWRRLVRCSPFVLVKHVLQANSDPLRVCPRH